MMVMVCEDTIKRTFKNGNIRLGFYLHKALKENLDYEITRLKKSWDCILLIDGEEGAGKSSFASAIAYYMSSKLETKFDNDDVIYTISQFEDWIENQPPYSVCQWDEFALAGMSSDALTKIQNILIKKMTVMRKKKLVVILVIPYFFMLRKYFAIARTKCLIHVYSHNNLDRGDFCYYNKEQKKRLYLQGLKLWDYYKANPSFHGNFKDTYGLFYDIDTYEQKKDEALNSIHLGDGRTKPDLWKNRFGKLVAGLRRKKWMWKEIGVECGIKEKQLEIFTRENGFLRQPHNENMQSNTNSEVKT
jgi:hypothetical protein